MSYLRTANLLRIIAAAIIFLFFVSPVHAFTANSLDITINKNGDAVATFKFTLEGFFENAIPESMLEEELKKGLTTSSEPPQLLSMDRSGTTMLLKKFADTRDVEQGTEYRTASMNFQTAEIALKNSALNNVVTADFSPAKIIITFPDAYTQQFDNTTVLPSITHIVIDPHKYAAPDAPQAPFTPGNTGTVHITASPAVVQVVIDGTYAGDSPQTFSGIPAGTHSILFRKEGFYPVTKNVTVVAGRTTNIQVSLIQGTQTAKAPSGLLPIPGFGLVIACLALGSCAILRKRIR